MSAGRRSARRQAVFLLYQQDLLKRDAEASLQRVEDDEVSEYARELVLGVQAERERIDALLADHVTGWSVERLGVLERSILRAALYELLMEPDVPEAVVIDQAVTLAKRFCSTEAGALVNGILGSLAGTARTGAGATEADERKSS